MNASDLRQNDKGATAAEYAIMVSLIAVVIIAAVVVVGETLRDDFFQFAADAIRNAISG